AVERLSILAAIAVADEQRWDGQERSTRYQNFQQSGYYIPEFSDISSGRLYRDTIDFLFDEYRALSSRMFDYLASTTARPEEMRLEAYERTLKARAFDISRYLLPLAATPLSARSSTPAHSRRRFLTCSLIPTKKSVMWGVCSSKLPLLLLTT